MDVPPSKFTERLSLFMVVIAALGGFLVLLDPRVTFPYGVNGVQLMIGGDGFSADLKGAVVSLILIGGWSAVKEYWLGSSASSDKKSETIAAVAVTATGTGTGAPIRTDAVNVETENTNITTGETK